MLKLSRLLTLLVCYYMVLQDSDFHLRKVMSCCGSAGLSPVWRNAVFGSKVTTADIVITFIELNHAASHILISNSKNIYKPMWRYVENTTISVAPLNSWKGFCHNSGSWNDTNSNASPNMTQMFNSVQLLKKKLAEVLNTVSGSLAVVCDNVVKYMTSHSKGNRYSFFIVWKIIITLRSANCFEKDDDWRWLLLLKDGYH